MNIKTDTKQLSVFECMLQRVIGKLCGWFFENPCVCLVAFFSFHHHFFALHVKMIILNCVKGGLKAQKHLAQGIALWYYADVIHAP